MPVIITNSASSPVFVPLNSGQTLRLSPAERSDELAEVEIKSNPNIEKLQRLRMIDIELITDQSSASKPKEAKSKSERSAQPKGG